MAIYEYRCAEHGTFDLSRPLDEAQQQALRDLLPQNTEPGGLKGH